MPMMTAQLVSMKSKFERVQNVAVVLHYFGLVTPSSMRAAPAILLYFASYKNSCAQARGTRNTASAKDPKQVAAQHASSKTALYIEPYQPPLCSSLKTSKHAIDGDFKQEWGLWSAYERFAFLNRSKAQLTGGHPHWYRGATAVYDYEAAEEIRKIGFKIAGFSVKSDAGATLKKNQILARLRQVKPRDVIIAHMNKPWSDTAEALSVGLLELLRQGFTFVRLDEVDLVEIKPKE
jgi:hypothetical protein